LEFAPALERALTGAKPALLELPLDPQAMTPNASRDAIRAAARKGGAAQIFGRSAAWPAPLSMTVGSGTKAFAPK
jgi:hypothetical protein